MFWCISPVSICAAAFHEDYNVDSHFRWNSIKKFIYLACTFSTAFVNFDIFSKLCHKVRLVDYLLCEITVGMTYMFMDCFIKQYTRRIDGNKFLNPLLRGINCGAFLQTGLWALIHAGCLADSLRFLVTSFQHEPPWARCQGKAMDCISAKDIFLRCRNNEFTKFNTTSAHFNYMKSFKQLDRSLVTTRFFIIGLVWLFNFFFSTVTDDTLLKILRLSFVCRTLSTLITIICISLSKKYYAMTAFLQILNINTPHLYTSALEHVSYTYGIGFLGLYDFGSVSPYTMVDNAVVIFTVLFTTFAFVRSWIVRILYLVLTDCVEVEISMTTHYLIFAVLPLSTEFLHAHKLYIYYIYVNVIFATMGYLTILTSAMSKVLQNQFRSVKNIYIIGLLCFLGFGLSLPITVSMTTSSRVKGLITGLNVTVLYLGGFKVAVVMWVYGVQRFSTDIHFWLGFKPTKFWTICWMLLPIVLLLFLIHRVYILTQLTDFVHSVTAAVWLLFSVLITAIFQFKTISKYMVRNNLAAAFKSTTKYGPPDAEDRKRRKNYNETIQHRQCKHTCNVLDDTFDCNHLPLIYRTNSSSIEPSLTSIFEAGTSRGIRPSSAYDLQSHQ